MEQGDSRANVCRQSETPQACGPRNKPVGAQTARRFLLVALLSAPLLAAEYTPPARQPLGVLGSSGAVAARPLVPSASTASHPLDPALARAQEGLKHIQENVRDYTATLIKQEAINGQISEYQFLTVKIRHRRLENGRVVVPFSVYLRFIGPPSLAGREVIWVEGRNEGKLVAHETGFKNLMRLKLDPTGFVAMYGNRYPITQIGFSNLIEELIKKGERDRARGECEVQFFKNAKVAGRTCTMIQVTHPQRRPYFDFFRARIFIDDELNIPIRYDAHSWPEREGGPPVLIEEYTYRDVKLNVGLTDRDFDPDNPEYTYP